MANCTSTLPVQPTVESLSKSEAELVAIMFEALVLH